MALNPPLSPNGDPYRIEGEYFVMKRKGIEFEFKVENGNKYTGKGNMILTTSRIICVNNKNSSGFKSFDLPLALISGEDFKQPIFGANYICGNCKPLMGSLPGIIKFKIWFMEGGCGTFAPTYLKMCKNIHRSKNRSVDQSVINQLQNGQYKAAYVDPSDPSVMYLQQPQVNMNAYNMQQYSSVMPVYSANVVQQQQQMQQPVYQPVQVQQQIPQQQVMYQQPLPNYQQQQQPLPNYQQQQPLPNYQQQQPLPNYQQQQQPLPNYQQQQQPLPNYQQQQENNYPDYSQINNQQQPLNNNINNNIGCAPTMQQQQQQQYVYPQQGNIYTLNNINIPQNQQQLDQQNQNNPKYFGFWGPSLKRNDNYNQNQ
jgi:hypothetical protein